MTCTITGTAGLPDGNLYPSAVFLFTRLPQTVVTQDGRAVVPKPIRVQSNASGAVSFELLPGNYTGVETATNLAFDFVVPDQASANWTACLNAAAAPLVSELPAEYVSMSGGGTAQDYAGFATRAAFVTWASGKTPPAGATVSAAGRVYRYIGTGTAISDLPGWVPNTENWLDMWPLDLAGFQAALTYSAGNVLRIPSGSFSYSSSSQNFFTAVNNVTIRGQGLGASFLTFTGTASFWFVFRGANFVMEDCAVTLLNGANVIGYLYTTSGGSGVAIRRCAITGDTAASGGVFTKDSNIISVSAGATPRDDIEISGCRVFNLSYAILRTNAATAQNNNIRIIGNLFDGCHNEVAGMNAPLGTVKCVYIQNNIFINHKMVADGDTDAHYAGVAGADKVVITGNHMEGAVREAIHVENAADSVIIENNTMDMDFTGISSAAMIAVLPGLNGAGTPPARVLIQNNICRQTGGSQLGVGIWCYDFTSGKQTDGGRNIFVRGNVVENLLYGYEVVWGGTASGRVSENNAVNCFAGYLARPNATRQYRGNISTSCTWGVTVSPNGTFVDHTFVNCTNIHGCITVGTVGAVSIDGFTIVGADQDFTAGQSVNYTLLNNVTTAARLSGTWSFSVATFGGSNGGLLTYAHRRSALSYDGTTFTENGVVGVGANTTLSTALSSNTVRTTLTITLAQPNVRASGRFDGYAFIPSPIVFP